MVETEVVEEGQETIPGTGTVQIGVSRPPLPVTDLPTPEEVFNIKGKMTPGKVVRYVLGPSMIALGVSIGSGEWLIGPFNVGTKGFVGILWVVLVSAVLQVFYNVELARFTIATGESPAIGFGRVPPGFWLWIPLAVFMYWLAFIWGGWASGAGQSLFVLWQGHNPTGGEVTVSRGLGAGLLFLVMGIVLFGRKISRTMEIANWVMVAFILFSVVSLVVLIVPASFSASAWVALVTPAVPPAGSTATDLGALAGFTATASGVNYFIISYYRDKGYGMGHRVGYIAALVGGKQEKLLASGMTFPADEKNTRLWKRWFRYLLIDQWGVFFTGAILGMMMPVILVGYLAQATGVPPTRAGMPVYAATQIGILFPGSFLVTWALIAGFLILFSTQMVVFEALVRQFVDGAHAMSTRFRKLTREDPRRFYYPFMFALAAVISLIVIFGFNPLDLVSISANFSNLASLIIPFAVIYLNRQLPAPARMKWWSYIVLLLNVAFFGFFFINFVADLIGEPLVKF